MRHVHGSGARVAARRVPFNLPHGIVQMIIGARILLSHCVGSGVGYFCSLFGQGCLDIHLIDSNSFNGAVHARIFFLLLHFVGVMRQLENYQIPCMFAGSRLCWICSML